MAAYRSGIKKVIIPADNVSDLAEIDSVVKDSVEFLPVEKIDQVLEAALTKKPLPNPLEPRSADFEISATAGQVVPKSAGIKQ